MPGIYDVSQGKTLADYYQPLNPVAVAEAIGSIQNNRIQRKVAEMQLEEKTRELSQDKEFYNALATIYGGQGGPQAAPGAATAPVGPGPAPSPQGAPAGPMQPPPGQPMPGGAGPMPGQPQAQPPQQAQSGAAPQPAQSLQWSKMPPNLQGQLWKASPQKAMSLMQADQTRQDDERKTILDYLTKQGLEHVKRGDQKGADSVTAAIRKLGYDVADVEVGDPGNMKTQVTVGPDGKTPTGQPLMDPYTKQPKPPGVYDVDIDNGKVSITEHKDDADAALKEFEKVTGTPPSKRGTPGYQAAFFTYQRKKTANTTQVKVNIAEGARGGRESKIDKQAQAIGDAIMAGKQPPVIAGFGMAKLAAPLKAYLAEQGYDLATAELDWKATQKTLQTLNGAQQVRLRQAVDFTYGSLDVIEDLGKQWNAGPFPPLNKANLMAAKNGVYGQPAAKLATKLTTQIADLQSELGTVYKGGFTSTDESLKLAAENLKGEWSEEVLVSNIDLIRQNLQIRKNSIGGTKVQGLSAGSKFGLPSGTWQSQPPAGKAAAAPGRQTATNPKTGHKIVSDDGGKTWKDAQTGRRI